MAMGPVVINVAVNMTGLSQLNNLSGQMSKISGQLTQMQAQATTVGTAIETAFGHLTLQRFSSELEHVFEVAGKTSNELAKLRVSGFTPIEIEQIQRQSLEISSKVPTMSSAEAMFAQREAQTLFRDAATPQLVTAMSQMTAATSALTGEGSEVSSRGLMRGAEAYGHYTTNGQTDPAKLQEILTAITRITIAGNGNYGIQTISHNLQQMAGILPQLNLDPNKLLIHLGALTEQMGDQAGSAMNRMLQGLYRGDQSQSARLRERLSAADMWDESKVRISADPLTGKAVYDTSKAIKGLDPNDPFAIYGRAVDNIKRKQAANPNFLPGVNAEQFVVQTFSNNVVAQRAIAAEVSEGGRARRESLEVTRDRVSTDPQKLMEQAMTGFSTSLSAFTKQLETFAGVALGPTINAITSMLGSLASAFSYLAQVAAEHPIIVTALNSIASGLATFVGFMLSVRTAVGAFKILRGIVTVGSVLSAGAGAVGGIGAAVGAAGAATGLAALGTTVAGMLGPIGWATGAIVALGIAGLAAKKALQDAADTKPKDRWDRFKEQNDNDRTSPLDQAQERLSSFFGNGGLTFQSQTDQRVAKDREAAAKAAQEIKPPEPRAIPYGGSESRPLLSYLPGLSSVWERNQAEREKNRAQVASQEPSRQMRRDFTAEEVFPENYGDFSNDARAPVIGRSGAEVAAAAAKAPSRPFTLAKSASIPGGEIRPISQVRLAGTGEMIRTNTALPPPLPNPVVTRAAAGIPGIAPPTVGGQTVPVSATTAQTAAAAASTAPKSPTPNINVGDIHAATIYVGRIITASDARAAASTAAASGATPTAPISIQTPAAPPAASIMTAAPTIDTNPVMQRVIQDLMRSLTEDKPAGNNRTLGSNSGAMFAGPGVPSGAIAPPTRATPSVVEGGAGAFLAKRFAGAGGGGGGTVARAATGSRIASAFTPQQMEAIETGRAEGSNFSPAVTTQYEAQRAGLNTNAATRKITGDASRFLGQGLAAPKAAGPRGMANLPAYEAGSINQMVGAKPGEFDIFRRTVAGIESGGKYNIMGGSSGRFAGAYQMGQAEIAETAARLHVPTPSRQEFLSNPGMQDKFFEAYTAGHHQYLMAHNEKYRNASPEERLKILGYAHNQGAGGASKWLNTGQAGRDAFGTSGTAYSTSIGNNLNKFLGSTPTPQTPTVQQAPMPNLVMPPPVSHSSQFQADIHLDGERIASHTFKKMFDTNPASTSGITGFDKKMTPWGSGTSIV